MSIEDGQIRPEIKKEWIALAAAESREFRADLDRRPRLHAVNLPPTKVELIRSAIPRRNP